MATTEADYFNSPFLVALEQNKHLGLVPTPPPM